MIPCIVLASVLKDNHDPQDLAAFKADYRAFQAGPILQSPFVVELKEAGSEDGGNGGGGESGGAPMKPELAPIGRSFWDFKTYPDTGNKRTKFPEVMRFEACMPFADIQEAAEFLARRSAGQRIRRLFAYVEIVAVSQPQTA